MTEKPGRPQPTGLQRVRHDQSNPAHIATRLFLPVAVLPQWELNKKLAQLLGLRGPWRCQVCRDMDCLHHRSYGPIRVSFWASCTWQSEGLFGQSFFKTPLVQLFRRLPGLGSFSVVQRVRDIRGATLVGVLLYRSVCQALKGAPYVGSYSVVHVSGVWLASLSTFQLPMLVCGERGGVMAPPPSMTQQHRLASLAACLSSMEISYHDLLPHIPSIYLSIDNSSPCPRIAPQSLNSSFQLLCLPGYQWSCPGYVWLQQGLCDSHSI